MVLIAHLFHIPPETLRDMPARDAWLFMQAADEHEREAARQCAEAERS